MDKTIQHFQLLKKAVEQKYQKAYPDCQEPIGDWKGKEIKRFQLTLRETLGAYLSEKWFYTHIKTQENKKLPRVDMLNLLAEYIGYKSWTSFSKEQEDLTCEPIEQQVVVTKPEKEERIEQPSLTVFKPNYKVEKPPRKLRSWQMLAASGLGILLVIVILAAVLPSKHGLAAAKSEKSYQFCFVDADAGKAIESKDIEILILKESESPQQLHCDSSGCFSVNYETDKIKFVVNAPYYKPDTIVRSMSFVDEGESESIALHTDDYALMIHYFSKTKIDDWEKRRNQLDAMLSQDVQVVQVYDGGRDLLGDRGVEIYNKWEFIDKLTMPLESLNNIEIIQTKYQGNRISSIRFRQSD